jgi:hypothetical protein
MDNIIRVPAKGLEEANFKQIDACFDNSLPWILIRTPENAQDQATVEVHFAINDASGHELIPMSIPVEQKIYHELTALSGSNSVTGYPGSVARMEIIFLHVNTTETEAIARQASNIVKKYFLV